MGRELHRIAVGVVVALICFPVSAARAENRALLIGASGYAAPISQLRGPANDIGVMWRLLAERGFEKANVRVLADRLSDALSVGASSACTNALSDPDCPTYDNIRAALAKLVSESGRGDYVVIYFSGHGVQVPDLSERDEPDGLTEAFVPLDIGLWDSSRQVVRNLLTDDEVGAAIENMRAKGAFVWTIFDTCHSGDMARGATSYAMPRMIRGNVLGIPDAAYTEARKGRAERPRMEASLGLLKKGHGEGLVGFYAAQSDQLALELAFEERDASGKRTQLVMGAMTNAIRRAFAQDPNPTYQQLAQRIGEIYGELGANMPAPYFEGDLNKLVFGGSIPEPTWDADLQAGRLFVTAGELNGVGEGAILALFSDVTSEQSSPVLGYARVERAAASRSEAIPIAFAEKKPFVTAVGTRLRVRLERPGIRAVLRVALPPVEDGQGSAPATSGRAAVELLRSAAPETRSVSIEWVEAGQPAEVHLRLRDGRVWLLTQFGDWVHEGPRQSPSVAVDETDRTAKVLQENLWRLARALNLQRLAGSYRQSVKGIEGTAAKALSVDLYLYRDTRMLPDQLVCPSEPIADGSVPKGSALVAADAPPEFRHCDIVYAVLRNTGKLPVDVTLLYIDAEAQIQCFNGWGKARIDPTEGRDRIQGFRIVTRDPTSGVALPIGRERLLVIGVEKPVRDTIETTFCHLQQNSLDSARVERGKRGATSAFAALVEEAGLATQPTRGFTGARAEDLTSVVMRAFTWEVREGRKM